MFPPCQCKHEAAVSNGSLKINKASNRIGRAYAQCTVSCTVFDVLLLF